MSELHEKINELTARMLTCTAHITVLMGHNRDDDLITVNPVLVKDAGSLLIEAATLLQQLKPPLEPMEIIESVPPSPLSDYRQLASQSNKDFWTDPGPPLTPNKPSPRACPKCGSRTQKIVHATAQGCILQCPVCSHRWPWVSEGKWI